MIFSDLDNTTINQLRRISSLSEPFPFYIHDAFSLNQYADFLENRADFVVLDHHSCKPCSVFVWLEFMNDSPDFVYTASDAAESAMEHTEDIDTGIQAMLHNTSSELRRNFVIEEWSCALTSESLSKEEDAGAARTAFCQTQMNVYENVTAGWSFWSKLHSF
jgi:glucan 1,3-beta-glucosidase